MFDFARRVQLAAGDAARRTALKVAAAVVGLVASGFLLAALWSFLADTLEWGAALASLSIGAGLAVIAGLLIVLSSRRRHEMPTTDDLKREVQARASLAADAAVDRARSEALRIANMAEERAHALIDEASSRAGQMAEDAERRVSGTLRSVGLGSTGSPASADRAHHPLAPSAMTGKLIGAFALGITLAAKIQERRRDHDLRRRH
ncbi:phage holin family protein [Paracoccus rhizosphaerae]|uniref:Phage holin family protein n=1 Tax=Paracoccus rhizosphaerae TaxID=1133347 RepID=A0ABV6CJA2_9RHOB|nr:phage holin family protein [Paracoccus rhizosphaerae]